MSRKKNTKRKPKSNNRSRSLQHQRTPSNTPQASTSSFEWRAPYPPPAALEYYEQIIPGFGELIIEQTNSQQKHRHIIESATINSDIKIRNRGQVLGTIFAIFALVAIVICAYVGATEIGCTLAATTVPSFVAAYAVGKSKKNENTAK